MTESLDKANFGQIYDQRDPRAYYRTLEKYDYRIPEHGADVLGKLLALHGGNSHILDVCCSYGVLGGLLKTQLSLADLYRHYRDPELEALTDEQLAEADRALVAERRAAHPPRVTGVDAAGNAVDYAVSAGFLDSGADENLETAEPSARLRDLLADVDLIVTTGGVGYVTEHTFGRLIAAVPPSAWIAAFCLRTYDYGPIEKVLAGYGFTTERAACTFPQRRFVDADEQRWCISRVRSRGLDPAGLEENGYYHADLFLSRPAQDHRTASSLLPDLFTGTATHGSSS